MIEMQILFFFYFFLFFHLMFVGPISNLFLLSSILLVTLIFILYYLNQRDYIIKMIYLLISILILYAFVCFKQNTNVTSYLLFFLNLLLIGYIVYCLELNLSNLICVCIYLMIPLCYLLILSVSCALTMNCGFENSIVGKNFLFIKIISSLIFLLYWNIVFYCVF
jgi:hypothetical protein